MGTSSLGSEVFPTRGKVDLRVADDAKEDKCVPRAGQRVKMGTIRRND